MRQMWFNIVIIFCTLLILQQCGKMPTDNRNNDEGSVTCVDVDGNEYDVVKIGDQWWMAENLKVTRYQNSDDIPNVTDGTEWSNLTTGAYCEFDNKSGRFLPGMFVAGEIHTGEDMVQALPESAVVRLGDNKYVIYYTDPSMQSDTGTSFQYTAVEAGHAEEGFIQVKLLSPISENAQIVTAGAYYIKTEMAKQNE